MTRHPNAGSGLLIWALICLLMTVLIVTFLDSVLPDYGMVLSEDEIPEACK